MFKEAISPLMISSGDDCVEFRLARGVSADPLLTVDGPEAQFTSVGGERWDAETLSLLVVERERSWAE